jgi:transposase
MGISCPEQLRGRQTAHRNTSHLIDLKAEQRFRLRDLLRYNLKTVRAFLLKEAFQQLWEYSSPAWAGKFLDEWCRQSMRSRIEPMPVSHPRPAARSAPPRPPDPSVNWRCF